MIIATVQLGRLPRRYAGEEPPSMLEMESDAQVVSVGVVSYDMVVQRFARELLVRGSIAVDLEVLCAKCGERCKQTVRCIDFARSYALASGNELIDLTPDMREAIFLAFPMNFTCSEDCRGLCARCGVNLNKAPCICNDLQRTSAWGALDQWKKLDGV